MNLSQASGNAGLAAILALFNSGTLVIYSGVQPATPETALSGNTLLVTTTFTASAFNAQTVSGGDTQSAANFTAASYAPTTSGTASFARAFKSDGVTAIADFTVGTTGTDIIIGNTAIQTGTNVAPSLTLKLPVS